MTQEIHNFIDFVENPNLIDQVDKLNELESKLISLLQFCNKLDSRQGKDLQKEYDYKEIRKKISQNFIELEKYNDTLEVCDNVGNSELAVGDALDDLTDIVKDLKESLTFQNEKDINSHLLLAFKLHFKTHIINLLRYLNFL